LRFRGHPRSASTHEQQSDEQIKGSLVTAGAIINGTGHHRAHGSTQARCDCTQYAGDSAKRPQTKIMANGQRPQDYESTVTQTKERHKNRNSPKSQYVQAQE
jgi:hypothetical protein